MLRVKYGAPLTDLNSPVVLLLIPRQCPLYYINMLFVVFILLIVCVIFTILKDRSTQLDSCVRCIFSLFNM